MFKQWIFDIGRASLPLKILLIISFPLYPLYRLLRFWRSRRRGRSGGTTIVRLGALSGALTDIEAVPPDEEQEAEIAKMEDRFALCRVIGNDLEPRHKTGQTLANVRFILQNEADFEGVTKLWLLNRIFNSDTEAKIIQLLEEHGQIYRRIPFVAAELLSTGFNFETFEDLRPFYDGEYEAQPDDKDVLQAVIQAYQPRNNYVMHNNGARNAALEFCIEHAKWALPFDGNCFLTQAGWDAVCQDVLKAKDKRYFVVPMARIANNTDLLDPKAKFEANEEPQLMFRCDAPLRFNEDHPYGRRPKVELFLHLGIEGPWQYWPHRGFDIKPRKVHPEGYRVGTAGWVARLASGKSHLEVAGRDALINRGLARSDAIRATLDMLESRVVADVLAQNRCLIYDASDLATLTSLDAEGLLAAANEALERGPFSVTDKPKPGPSGDLHDYFHPAPYWWPNPKSNDGLPYIRKDGQRLPGTELYEPESDQFDRTRLQRLFDDTVALALASRLPNAEPAYRSRALGNLKAWFIEPETAMAPNLEYAQVRMGHNGNKGAARGLIETKDFYFLLDAVRLLDDAETTAGLTQWCDKFLVWFLESDQGGKERTAANNHGTCYDLQAAALAAFLGRVDLLQRINLRAQARAIDTITPEGDQPHELGRTLTQHYYAFNLQSWVNLFDVLTSTGLRPWESAAGERVRVGIRRMLQMSLGEWTHPQIKPFDADRVLPLNEALKNQTGENILAPEATSGPISFYPHDGVAPFWRLTRLGRQS